MPIFSAPETVTCRNGAAGLVVATSVSAKSIASVVPPTTTWVWTAWALVLKRTLTSAPALKLPAASFTVPEKAPATPPAAVPAAAMTAKAPTPSVTARPSLLPPLSVRLTPVNAMTVVVPLWLTRKLPRRLGPPATARTALSSATST